MGKLHEVLAVEQDLKGQAQRAMSQVKGTFGSPERFLGQVRVYEALEEGGDQFPREEKELATTVDEQLGVLRDVFGRYLDATIQKEVTNQITHADVVIGGTILFPDLPATALLNLEARLAEIRDVFRAIPTNDPTEKWYWDEDGECWKSATKIQYRTAKRMGSYVAYEATPEHPAQVEVYNEDVRVGTWATTVKSGMIHSSQKRLYLERIEALMLAVKQARQRANDVEVEPVHMDKVFGFIFS